MLLAGRRRAPGVRRIGASASAARRRSPNELSSSSRTIVRRTRPSPGGCSDEPWREVALTFRIIRSDCGGPGSSIRMPSDGRLVIRRAAGRGRCRPGHPELLVAHALHKGMLSAPQPRYYLDLVDHSSRAHLRSSTPLFDEHVPSWELAHRTGCAPGGSTHCAAASMDARGELRSPGSSATPASAAGDPALAVWHRRVRQCSSCSCCRPLAAARADDDDSQAYEGRDGFPTPPRLPRTRLPDGGVGRPAVSFTDGA